jgi:adenylate kinase family enzyme
VSVVGCSGSGKTTLASTLARLLDAPHIELDAIFHQPGWTELPRDTFRQRVDQATAPETWVVDGNYSSVRDVVWRKADLVVWFDLPFATVVSRTVRRTVRRVITREELWNGNKEPFSNLWSFDPQHSIIAWTVTQHGRYRRQLHDASADPQWSGLQFVRIGSQGEAHGFLAGVAAGMGKEE